MLSEVTKLPTFQNCQDGPFLSLIPRKPSAYGWRCQDGNGFIDRIEIAEVMRAMGEELDDES